MRIVIDAMGSDNAPFPEVRGAIEASDAAPDLEVILVGDQARLEPLIHAHGRPTRVQIRHASETITMHDSPVQAVRQKKDSSLLVGMRMVKNGEADGIVSAANTGAVQVASRIILGPIRGVARSAICSPFPSLADHNVLLIDLGANVDCSARHLCEFAEMGMVYAERALNVKNPRIGLINIGEEQMKGNELTRTVHRYLSAVKHINFIGNVEPMCIFKGEVDVAVCDGFIGNLVLKSSEAAAYFVREGLRREIMSNWLTKIGGMLCAKAFAGLRKRVDPNDQPGAPLLGVNGTVIIIHGRSTHVAVRNAVFGASRAIETRINHYIREEIQALRATEASLNRAAESALSSAPAIAAMESTPAPAPDNGSVLLYPGQGSQSPGMGLDIYEKLPSGRTVFERAAHAVPGLLDAMFQGPAERLAQTHLAQVALFTVEYALTQYLLARGHSISACAGHSLGEFAALVGSGCLPFEDALQLVMARGRIMADVAPSGGMAAVIGVSPDAISATLPPSVVIANYNGPLQTIISGPLDQLEAAENALKSTGPARVIRLSASGPFHSPLMEPAAQAFRNELSKYPFNKPQRRFISSVTAQEESDPERIRDIIGRQMTAPVRWTEVMQHLGPVNALEVGPGKVLLGLAKRMAQAPLIQPAGAIDAINTLEIAS